MRDKINICWLRRELRLNDNTALFHSLKNNIYPTLILFIFDDNILQHLKDKKDKRVTFIFNALQNLNQQLAEYNTQLLIVKGTPQHIFEKLFQHFDIQNIYVNHDYENYSIQRDETIQQLAKPYCNFYSYKDQVIFEKNEILKDDGKPYTVFTPYSKKYKQTLLSNPINIVNTQPLLKNLYVLKDTPFKTITHIEDIDFTLNIDAPKENIFLHSITDIIKPYNTNRDNLALTNGTSLLGIHLRFGTISIRELMLMALPINETFVNELIWRDFYKMILWHFTYVEKKAFNVKWQHIKWQNNLEWFDKWKSGQTGYALIDAAMHQINKTGFMHNRTRMLVASFLVKNLLIDWQWGEKYFADILIDFDLSANNGGWQWAAGCGCDAAPYFRIFNPMLQQQKFDPNQDYIKRWLPNNYNAKPIVDFAESRNKALEFFKLYL